MNFKINYYFKIEVAIRMVSFQICSDLHIEWDNNEVPDPLELITPTADVLILAGDIGSLYKYEQLYGFLKEICKYFQYVLYVPGNHEYYKIKDMPTLTFSKLRERLHKLSSSIDNLIILNRSSIQIGNICIIGCTLWSLPKVKVPPFLVRIYGINNEIYRMNFENDVKYIKRMINYCNQNNLKLMVVTHYLPTYDVVPSHLLEKKYISLYASDLNDLFSRKDIDTWIAGHIHYNFDTKINGTRLVSNQKGKPRDNITDYKKEFVIKF